MSWGWSRSKPEPLSYEPCEVIQFGRVELNELYHLHDVMNWAGRDVLTEEIRNRHDRLMKAMRNELLDRL